MQKIIVENQLKHLIVSLNEDISFWVTCFSSLITDTWRNERTSSEDKSMFLASINEWHTHNTAHIHVGMPQVYLCAVSDNRQSSFHSMHMDLSL